MKTKTALCLGAGGFICSHMVTRLKKEGYWVRGADLKYPEYTESDADEFVIADLRNPVLVKQLMDDVEFDLVIQMAADMGGAEYIFTGEHDADVLHNSALINLNVAHYATACKAKKVLYTSSACIYPQEIQEDSHNPGLRESDDKPYNPDSDYGIEKIFSERLYDAYRRNYGLNIRIVRFHNVYGINGTWEGIRAKAPAALCRKIASASEGNTIDVLGDGQQTRSFIEVSEAIEGCMRLLESDYYKPVNIGSSEMISINDFAYMIIGISDKRLYLRNVKSDAIGVRGRNSNNDLIEKVLGWKPTKSLVEGTTELYNWINKQVNK